MRKRTTSKQLPVAAFHLGIDASVVANAIASAGRASTPLTKAQEKRSDQFPSGYYFMV